MFYRLIAPAKPIFGCQMVIIVKMTHTFLIFIMEIDY